MVHRVVLKNLENDKETITLHESENREHAEVMRRRWRTMLGGKRWTVNRRPGVDTLDHLVLTVTEVIVGTMTITLGEEQEVEKC